MVTNMISNIKFFSGGKAIFTVSNDKGDHYTYRIGRNDEKQPFFVELLTGNNNESDYTYMGLYNPLDNTIRLTKASKYTPDSKPVKVIQWALSLIAKSKSLPTGYAIQHQGKCCCCGKPLTTPESVTAGIGPICAEKNGWI